MQVFVCPRDWTFAKGRFEPDHMVSLQDPGADVSGFRPPWVPTENHYVGFFYDANKPGHPDAVPVEQIAALLDWLIPRCSPGSQARFLIHCDAGLGRSPAVAYIAWALHFGPGHEAEAFESMKRSCLESRISPNSIVIHHADRLLGRDGLLEAPVTDWNRKVTWRRDPH